MLAKSRGFAALILLALALLAPTPARAIIVFGGHDASGNPTTTGSNLNPAPFNLGAYEGLFGDALATPIGPRYVVTASHIPGSATFEYNNGTATTTTYHMTAVGSAPDGSDLTVYKIADTDPAFTLYAPLYTGSDEVGNPLVTIGRGTARGTPFLDSSNVQRGWNWATYSAPEPVTWGTGTVSEITAGPSIGAKGDLVTFRFTQTPDASGDYLNHGIFSPGDSGGATFVRDPADGTYKLAGINSYVQEAAPTPNSGGFSAALFDAHGYYDADTGAPLTANPYPLASYATRISTEQSFLDQFVPVPEPTSLALAAIGGLALAALARRGRLRRRAG